MGKKSGKGILVVLGIAVLGLIGIRAWENQKKQTGDGSYSVQTVSREEDDVSTTEFRSIGEIAKLDSSQVEIIEYRFSSGLKDSEHDRYAEMSLERIPAFMEFLAEVRLGEIIPGGESVFSGARGTYTIVMKDGS